MTPLERWRLEAMERSVGSTFFSPDKVSRRYRSFHDPATGVMCATADDVRRWATGDMPAGGLFAGAKLPVFKDEGEDPFAPACSSVYVLCE